MIHSIIFFKDIFNKNKILFMIILVLLVRLLINCDNFLTLRDFDFFDRNLSVFFRGGRPLALFINSMVSEIIPGGAISLKHIFAKCYLLVYIPIFLNICSEFGQNNIEKSISLILLLSNAVVFTIYDCLAPYFLLTLLIGVQLIFTLEIINGNRSFQKYFIVTVLLFFCHFISNITFLITLSLIIFFKKYYFRFKYNLFLIAVLFCNMVFSFFAIYLWNQGGRELKSPQLINYFSDPDNTYLFIKKVFVSLIRLLPDVLGLSFDNIYLFILFDILIIIILIRVIKSYQKPLVFFSVSITLASIIFVFSSYFFNRFFDIYIHRHTLYISFIIPYLIIFVATFLGRLKTKYFLWSVVFIISIVNIFIGSKYRKEAFDYNEYNLSVLNNPDSHLRYYISPPIFTPLNLKMYGKYLKNDKICRTEQFPSTNEKEYIFDIVEYMEFGDELYLYSSYEKDFEKFLIQNNYAFNREQFKTFKRYTVKMN